MTPTHVKEALEARATAVTELRSLFDSAEGRELTAEESVTADRINADIDQRDAVAAAGLEHMQREQAASEVRSNLEGMNAEKATAPAAAPSDLDNLLGVIKGEQRSADFAPIERRSLEASAANEGAEFVPAGSVHSEVYLHAVDESPIMEHCTVINTAAGAPLSFPTTTAYSAAAIITEAAAITPSDPATAEVTLNAHKYGVLVQVSSELVQDSAFDAAAFVIAQGGAALGRGINADLIAGAGTTEPLGILSNTAGKVCASSTVFTLDDVMELVHSVPTSTRRASKFIFSDTAVQELRTLKTGISNDTTYAWQPSVIAGQPDTLLGYEVLTDPNAPVQADGVVFAAFGDLSGYYTRFSGGLSVERSDDFAFSSDLVTFRFLLRADGATVGTEKIRTLESNTA